MTGSRVTAAALVALLLLGGCSDSKPSQSAGGGASTSTTEQADDDSPDGEDDHPKPTLVDPKTGKQGKIGARDKYTASSPPPVGFRDSDVPPQTGDVPLTVSVTPACVEHGQELTAVFKSDPGVTVAAQIKWPNGEFAGLDNTRSTTGPDGTHTWKVEVQPTALVGQADVMAAAIDERNSSRTGSSGSWQFVVASPGRC